LRFRQRLADFAALGEFEHRRWARALIGDQKAVA
jgi:hypothetical protein